jgi:HEAT repeat protein
MGALRALKELRCKETLKPALEALQDSDAAVRVQAIGVIGFLKLEESIPALTALINDPDAHVRRAAVSALAFSHLKPAAETITRALKDSDWMVREMAAETLGLNVNGSIAADQLVGSLADEFWQVRLKAIRSLGKMKIERTVRPIGGCITREQANLRKEAAAALGEIAIGEGEAYFALVANDPDPDVQKNARWALQHSLRRMRTRYLSWIAVSGNQPARSLVFTEPVEK